MNGFWKDAVILDSKEDVDCTTNDFRERATLQEGMLRLVSFDSFCGLLNVKPRSSPCDLVQSKTSQFLLPTINSIKMNKPFITWFIWLCLITWT